MRPEKHSWLYDLLFVAVLLVAALLRFSGVDWGEGQHQHPDELFISGVTENLRAHACRDASVPVDACPRENQRWLNPLEYFNTATSTLNPANRGSGFFVYGNLPIILVRVSYEMLGDNAGPLKYLGRQFSAMSDLFSIVILYLLVSRLYGRRTGLLASAFSALAVMEIQQSHFYTVDLFMLPFILLALYFAVKIAYEGNGEWEIGNAESREITNYQLPITNLSLRNPLILNTILFGLALGMAAACKINAVVLAVALPAALAIRFSRKSPVSSDQLSVASDQSGKTLNTEHWKLITASLIAGGLVTILAFRIFQPYAFSGLVPSPEWLKSMGEIRNQATGLADLPWNLQWARRTNLYSFTNLTVWGLGLPLGILAWAGFLFMGWRILKGERQHILLWGWTALYFGWQSLQFNATMRYQLPIYPMLAMMAAWIIVEGLKRRPAEGVEGSKVERPTFDLRPLTTFIGSVVLILTALWAFAFAGIYTRPETRIAASRWIYENIPGPINLNIQTTNDANYQQPLPFPSGIYIQPGSPYQTVFTAQTGGLLKEVTLEHVTGIPSQSPAGLHISVWQNLGDTNPLAFADTLSQPNTGGDTSRTIIFQQTPLLLADQPYYLKVELSSLQGLVNVCGALNILLQTVDNIAPQTVAVSAPCTISFNNPYMVTFIPQVTGTLSGVMLEHVTNADLSTLAEQHVLSVIVSAGGGSGTEETVSASVTSTFAASTDPRGDSYTLTLDQPLLMKAGIQYSLRVETDSGLLTLSGAAVTNETDYDFTLPFRVNGYDAFGGLYRGDLNLQVYWDDNADKLARLTNTLNQTDYIFIPTNHQYAQITRIPERFPLTTVYYRELIGCPAGEDIIWCYRVAEPGMFTGRLGFELVATFESYPTLGPLTINDQAAEEAFTFYDHPKVLIFKKTAGYDAAKVANILGAVDLTKVVHLLPNQAAGYEPPKKLVLPPDRLASQQAGGTWSQLFNYDWIQNKYPALGMLFWYAFIFLLGLVTYPLTRRALPGLSDKGYALSRTLGMAILAYVPWLMGSLGIAYTRESIAAVFGGILLLGLWQAWAQKDALVAEWKSNRRGFLITEAVFLALFLIDSGIRLANPDLWHPYKGGERPMDFSYFNAVLKSTSFPPYDPWFAGGYINYYYYGFVLVGTPVKLLGIVPSIAYNFILPTLFALVGVSAYSIGSNLVKGQKSKVDESHPASPIPQPASLISDHRSLITGIASTILILLLGNLGTIRTIWMAFQRVGAPQGVVGAAGFLLRTKWAFDGFAKTLTGTPLPIGVGEWYWNPSRVIPAPNDVEPITEFPLFTFLYSDMHAHMIVLILALFIIAWGLSYILALRTTSSTPYTSIKALFTEHWSLITLPILFGALVLGAIYPTNTWDSFTYIPLSAIAVGYALFNVAHFKENKFGIPTSVLRFTFSLLGAFTLVALARLMYQPYFHWFGTAYGDIAAWTGSHTPLTSYFTHWGLFLFLIFAWMIWETREWMAATPLSHLGKLKPHQLLIEIALAGFVVVLLYLLYRGARISLVALPLAFWAAILILRPQQDDAKRWVLFMIGTSLALTIAVELIVLVGDIGRMNTVFKLYLQGWTMLAVSAAAALGWVLPSAVSRWTWKWVGLYQAGFTLLAAGAFLFTLAGTSDKMRDRMNPEAPHTLDSMTFMATTQHWDSTTMDLGQDYRAIRWMQDNIQGSPVIVEGNCVEYRWCTRFTVYTGLPSVLGWNWHQRQQRGFVEPLIIENRLAEISAFYTTINPNEAIAFLKKHSVRYIIVGQIENIYYPGEGLLKFESQDGGPWTEVYRDGDTVIYKVNSEQ